MLQEDEKKKKKVKELKGKIRAYSAHEKELKGKIQAYSAHEKELSLKSAGNALLSSIPLIAGSYLRIPSFSTISPP